MHKENQRIALTKRMLKESLISLMEEKSLQKISITELCRTAGINRATFYNHYDVPSDLLDEMGRDMAEEINRLLNHRKLEDSASLRRTVEFVCEYLIENQRIARLLFMNNTPESTFATEIFHVQDNWEALWNKLATSHGQYGQELLKTFFINGMYCMITRWLLDGMQKTPREMGELISNISINEFFA